MSGGRKCRHPRACVRDGVTVSLVQIEWCTNCGFERYQKFGQPWTKWVDPKLEIDADQGKGQR